MEQKTWTVVAFEAEGAVAVVPSTWIIGTNECLWPPFTADKTTTAIKNHDPINTCWPSFRIRTFRDATYDDYALAREKCRKAEETSDLGTDGEEMNRRSRRAKRILSSSDDEDNSCSFIKTPPRPKKNLKHSNMKKDELPPSDLPHTPSMTCSQNVRTVTPVSTAISEKNTCNQSTKNNDYIKEVLRQQYLIKNMVSDLLLEIRSLKKTSVQEFTSPEDSVFKKLSLPCKTDTELTQLNEYLQDAENFKNAITEISQIGGKDGYDFVRRVMSRLVTNDLAAKYSWLGRREKSSFYSLRVAKLVIDGALSLQKGNEKDIESHISAWLRRSGERLKSKRL